MEFTIDELSIIKGCKREIIYGMGVQRSYSEKEIVELIEKIESTKDCSELSCNEIKILRDLIVDLLRELDEFEFSTRMGFSLDEVYSLFKKVKHFVDGICYGDS